MMSGNANPIYKKFFLNRSILNGKVFDSNGSQLFRLERATDRLLPQLHPTSRPVFERSSNGLGLIAHTLQLIDEGASTRNSLINKNLGMNRKLGRRIHENGEKTLRSHLNQLNSLINKFKR